MLDFNRFFQRQFFWYFLLAVEFVPIQRNAIGMNLEGFELRFSVENRQPGFFPVGFKGSPNGSQ